MADFVEDRVGQQLGNYRLLRLLRQESTTDVYLGEHIFLKTQAAIEVLPGRLSEWALEAFLAEARTIARMKHPNILRILEFGVEGQIPFLVTDYTPNGSLRQRHPAGTIVPPGAVASYTRQVATALQYMHDQGLIHRSVRPENMLLGPQDRILLSNFSPISDTLDGAPMHGASSREEEKAAIYTAPEQLQGQPIPSSDQYALGVTVYEWLSGDLPFQSSSGETQERSLLPLSMKVPTASPELVQIVMTALAEDPQQRFANVTAFADALDQQLQPAQPTTTNPPTNDNQKTAIAQQNPIGPLTIPTRKLPRRNLTMTISLVLLALLLIGGVFLYNVGIFPFSRQKISVTTPAQATQAVLAKGTQQAVAAFASRSPQEIYTAATQGNPSLNDPLNDKSRSTWLGSQGSSYSCAFAGGAYHVRLAKANSYLGCLAPNITLHNFAFQVEVNIVKGDVGGIIFRSNYAKSNFYTLRVAAGNPNAFCSFTLYGNNTVKDVQNTIAQANLQQFTLLTVISYENVFYFYLNRNFVMKSQDSTLSTGAIGMYAANSSSSTTEVMFRNARAWKL